MNALKSHDAGVCRRRLPTVALISFLALSVTVSFVQGAGLLIADGGFGGILEIEEQDVQVTINNGIAVTRIEQVFRNTENRQVECLYTFPVPKQASVSNFSMWINGKEMVGEVVEKQRAREIYNSYKKQRRDPGLLEQKDYKTFEMRIFPVEPKAAQKVQLVYYQELDWDNDWVTYTYPLATSAGKITTDHTTGRFALDVQYTSEIPITATECPSHSQEMAFAKHTPHLIQASLETREGSLARDIVIAFQLKRPKTGLDMISCKQSGEDGYFCLMLTAGEELSKRLKGMDYVFILDISGSMAHDGKMRLSRSSIGEFINVLDEEDRFDIITFNVSPASLFKELRPATVENEASAADFLSTQEARGGTVLNPALSGALRYATPDRSLNIVILSDGMTEQSERAQLLSSISGAPSNVRVFCIGVGNEVNRPLLRQLAEDAGGLAAFVSHGDNFARQAQAFRRKLTRPVATNLKIDFPGNSVYDLEPKTLPNLYHGTPIRVYGRYRSAGPAEVRLTADVGSFALNKTAQMKFPANEDTNPEIERMWAWHRVQRLQKEAGPRRPSAVTLDEIIRLGEGYSIVTEYTSFLVLENDAEYKRWKIQRRNALRMDRDRKALAAVRDQFDRLRSLAQIPSGPIESPTVGATKPAVLPVNGPAPSSAPSTGPSAAAPRPRRGIDLDLGVGGGGAFDPMGLLLVLLGAAACYRIEAKRETGKRA